VSSQPTSNCGDHQPWLTRLVPARDWLRHYERKHLPGDALAGVIVATLLIPQGMAYALLAGVLTSFLSHPVLSGFSSAAAIIIALSQVKHLLGVKLPQTEHFHESLGQLARAVPRTRMQDAGIQLYLTEVKGPVMDRLADTEFLEQLGHECAFLTTQVAYEQLASAAPAPTPTPL
jgi:hypothetical protein